MSAEVFDRGGRPGSHFDERIMHRKLTVDDETAVHVFGEQSDTAGFQSRRCDQGVVERELVSVGQLETDLMRPDRERCRWGAEPTYCRQCLGRLGPGQTQLPAGDGGKLVQHLHAYRAATAEQVQGDRLAPIALCESVNQNVGVEEDAAQLPRSFNSSRLNRKPGGSGRANVCRH